MEWTKLEFVNKNNKKITVEDLFKTKEESRKKIAKLPY